ncbi:MAG: neutral/alkaline non-lysosomal ceramidase N-terminal domain-containing protein [Pirellulales bacterium]
MKNQNLFIIELEPGNHYAIVLTDGKHKFSLVTVDIVGFPPPVKNALVDRLAGDGWTKQQLMLLPSHSHTSIDMNAINPANTFNVPQIRIYNPRVFDFVIARLAQVVQDAQRQMTPVSIGTSSISIDGWNRNRRGGAVTDKELTVTRVDSAQGKPLAALINFTAHPTFMSGEDMLFSGDWPGYLQRTLESLIGEGVVAMYYNGAEGDQCQSPDPQPGPAGGNARSTTAAIWPSLPGSSGSKRQREETSLFLITCTLSRCPSTPHIPTL